MRKLSRHDVCELKIAQDEKNSINQDLHTLYNKQTLSFKEARQARRDGFLKRASNDLYENVETKSFWKINKNTGTIERVVDVDKNGFVKE